jgi:hypothetical protein
MTKDDEVKSGIYIEFQDPNDVRFDVQYLGQVHPGQVIYACRMLQVLQESNLLGNIIKQQMDEAEKSKNKIVTPQTKFVMER